MFHPQGFEICFLNTTLGQREGFACLELIGLLQKHFPYKILLYKYCILLNVSAIHGTEIFESNSKIPGPDF